MVEIWAHSEKVANVTLANPRNQQKWIFLDLAKLNYSPWCTTWCSVIIWVLDHVHKVWDQMEKVGNVKLFKFGSGQRGFWGTFVNKNYFD